MTLKSYTIYVAHERQINEQFPTRRKTLQHRLSVLCSENAKAGRFKAD